MENSRFLNAAEVAADFGVSESKAYTIIKELNDELKEKGYITVAGRVSRKYYIERTYSYDVRCDYQEEIAAQMGCDTNLILKTFEKVVSLFNMFNFVTKNAQKSGELADAMAWREEFE